MKIRKSEQTLASYFLMFVLVLFLFFGMFQWWNYNLTNSGQVMNQTYSDLNENLTNSQTELNNDVTEIREDLEGLTEPEAGIFVTAINGVRGLLNAFLLPIKSIDLFSQLIQFFTNSFNFLPSWVLTLAVLAVIIAILFIIYSIIAGANQNIAH